ncbi:cobalamin (vitamin B12) biosynthesis CbiG protein [Alkalidesulfovibrio alkalitolerans DSM 16529]|uniref:Cobalamin (Vitamin B12) biosynthesis CbiG protein n=1 Tax=Alkalidesulfovibrio alkalitolerans DSM 16529 TaxID=1121439 RepID=S7TFM7_9BACT|nr:cobalamin biosynthesis protein [Alkalidesulfovibrio alkalitolerans]EPR35390.1 cobalamin (vitamin B12) biosynthesis CbiG protein [Alkalidesulfovibrio alkalitolerans DSM 16529]
MADGGPKIAFWALTGQGLGLARRLAAALPGAIFAPSRLAEPGERPFDELLPTVAAAFSAHTAHVFVCAAGIAVRAVAPHLRAKDTDPAVVVMDQNGRFAVPILSGHLGGANALAARLALISGGTAVITTATDTEGLPAIDLLAQERGMTIADLSTVKRVSAALLDGARVPLHDPDGLFFAPGDPHLAHFAPMDAAAAREKSLAVWVQWRKIDVPAGHLRLVPRVVRAGLGCRRGTPADAILACLRKALDRAGADERAVGGLASIDLKADEPGLTEAARTLGAPLTFYDAARLSRVAAPNPSARVEQATGSASVAEAAALLLAQATELLCEKTICPAATAALALARPRPAA